MSAKSQIKNGQPPFVSFLVEQEHLDENGIWNPRDDEAPLEGGFQLNVMGTSKHYLQLSNFFREFAEQNTSADSDYHEHFEELMSADGKVRLHVILRKDDIGNSSFKDWFPKSKTSK